MAEHEHPFASMAMRPLKRGKKLCCETAAVSRTSPLWWKIWCGALLLGSAVGLRSLAATDVRVGSQPPFSEPRPCLSGDGRVLAVEMRRPQGWQQDIQVHWLEEGRKKVVQQGVGGVLVDDSSRHPTLDRSGRRLAFSSLATNWVAGDDNSVSDIFAMDLESGSLERILPPAPEPGLSASYEPCWAPAGDCLAFTSYGWPENRPEKGRALVMARRGPSGWSSRSLPGRRARWGRGPVMGRPSFCPRGERIAYTAFQGGMTPEAWRPRFHVYASSVEGDDWPPVLHPSRQRDYQEMALLSHTLSGRPARGNSYQPCCSEAGVVFASLAPDLGSEGPGARHHLYFRAWNASGPVSLTVGSDGSSFEPCCSADGRWVVFTSYASNLDSSHADDNSSSDIFLMDRQSGRTQRLSRGLKGACFHPSCSEDARRVAFVHDGRLLLWQQGQGLRVLESRL